MELYIYDKYKKIYRFLKLENNKECVYLLNVFASQEMYKMCVIWLLS